MNNARYEPRIRRLAGVLGMDWLPGTWVDNDAQKFNATKGIGPFNATKGIGL